MKSAVSVDTCSRFCFFIYHALYPSIHSEINPYTYKVSKNYCKLRFFLKRISS